MELVYLWVDKYKNIENQGFNFSPRFTCSYDGKNLTINKKEHVSIFPDNINVTAIVGENGSGKTSILEEIITNMQNGVVIYFVNNKLEILGHERILKILHNNTDYIDNRLETNILENMQLITSDMMRLDKMEDFSDYFFTRSQFSNIHWSMSNDGLSKIDLTKYERSINALIIRNYDIFDSTFFDFKPINIQIYSKKEDFDNSLSLIRKIESFIGTGITTNITELQLTKEELNSFANYIGDGTIAVGIKNSKNIKIFDLSQGERKSFVDSLILFDFIYSHENCLILLDEPDLTIHPKLQKRYINDLINSFQNFHKNIHFVITSHSPFILSDLPKENIIFLEKYKKEDEEVTKWTQKIGNCKNVTSELNIETFGANIHTLLSHGFFMEDGLMGEFAKEKITEILDYLKNNKPLKSIKEEQVKSIIEKIGEDFLRQKLLNMYNIKFSIKSKDDEIEELKAEIERLNNAQNQA